MARCAVTGADGFLGSHMVKFLEKKGHEVVKTPRIQRLSEWEKTFKDSKWVFHFAANTGGVGYMSQHEYETAKTTLGLDLNVIHWCEKFGNRLFYPSSACMYPTETGEPQGMYGYEKQFITKLSEHAPFDMRVGILGTVYGPGQKTGEKGKFPVDICQKVIAAEKQSSPKTIELWGDGKQVRSFLYVDDAIEMCYEMMLADEYTSPTNIASEEQVTVKEIADVLKTHAGIKARYIFRTDKPTGAQERREDMSEWNKRYSYRPQTTASAGFPKLYDWLNSQTSLTTPA